jgi:hypothetical protein
MAGAAVHDPQRPIATVICRTAKGYSIAPAAVASRVCGTVRSGALASSARYKSLSYDTEDQYGVCLTAIRENSDRLGIGQ